MGSAKLEEQASVESHELALKWMPPTHTRDNRFARLISPESSRLALARIVTRRLLVESFTRGRNGPKQQFLSHNSRHKQSESVRPALLGSISFAMATLGARQAVRRVQVMDRLQSWLVAALWKWSVTASFLDQGQLEHSCGPNSVRPLFL